MIDYTADRDGERIDVFLARQDEALSRSYIQRLITEGRVTVEGKTVKARYRLTTNEKVVADIPESEPVNVAAENIPLDILYEDEDVIVVNKARGMVVHPAAGCFMGRWSTRCWRTAKIYPVSTVCCVRVLCIGWIRKRQAS